MPVWSIVMLDEGTTPMLTPLETIVLLRVIGTIVEAGNGFCVVVL